MPLFERILIANRGEIARRVIRSCRALGVSPVAVYAEPDRDAPHVREADEALALPGADPRAAYLDAAALIAAAKAAGAEAIHPGYGFLSENPAFAESCAEAGIVFIGPPPGAMRAMAEKDAAKRLMAEAGVPVVPGYHGAEQDEATLLAEARRIGFPVLIKAVAGGGGKGMRLVEREADFAEALAAARREAAGAFGNDRVLIERYVTRPRHVEVQVFGDATGRVVALYERDCSIQRRHQKIVEEAPAPGLPEELRARMLEAAVRGAEAIGYVNAGTMEFIVDAAGPLDAGTPFYFMEMNTRLQVEHPVTEMVTGLDLVAWQIRVAAGEPLPADWPPPLSGHAIELRLYAEDPARGFLPQTGRIFHLRLPEGRPGIRADFGVEEGGAVTPHYDPMIGKLIAHGADREEARRRLIAALDALEIAGVRTNRAFLRRVVSHPAFAEGRVDTRFVADHEAELQGGDEAPAFTDWALAAAAVQHRRVHVRRRHAAQGGPDPHSPFGLADGFRLNLPATEEMLLSAGGADRRLQLVHEGECGLLVRDGEESVRIGLAGEDGEGRLLLRLDGRLVRLRAVERDHELHLFVDGRHLVFHRHSARWEDEEEAEGPGELRAPMPGRVLALKVKEGEAVERDAVLLVLEAMKMEHPLRAPRAGIVRKLAVREGDQVEEGALLLALADAGDGA
ncbi:MAG: 3-methylcrotonyl-CoA carboxylase subunit alpha [Rhodothalassiaceae bacterium]|nr:MAG: 3-methylcrotonyl-CoA carboxylase subunit alpha [Rhodothalassiaceae bacterium]